MLACRREELAQFVEMRLVDDRRIQERAKGSVEHRPSGVQELNDRRQPSHLW
jgi:hypothetical protein